LIIGATTVAIELAHFFATFGSTVSVAEQSSRILPTEDEEVSEAVSSLLQTRPTTVGLDANDDSLPHAWPKW